MICRVHDTLHWRMEGAMFLSAVVAGDDPPTDMEEMARKQPERAGEIEAMFASSIALHAAVAARVDAADPDLRLLFGDVQECNNPAWMLFMPQLEGKPGDRLAGFKIFFDEIDEDAAFADEAALVDYIVRCDLSYEIKGRLLLLCAEYERFEARLLAQVDRAADTLREHAALYEAEVAGAVRFMRETVEARGLEGLLAEAKVPIRLEESDAYDLYPHLAYVNSIRMIEGDMFLGVHYMDLGALKGWDVGTPDQVQEALRVLGDRTKFDIVRMLGEETLYGGELAARLGLSAATISHHIMQLTSARLLTIVKEGTRVYYRTDKDMLAAYLDAARALLT